jgi:hypothetical protein
MMRRYATKSAGSTRLRTVQRRLWRRSDLRILDHDERMSNA